MLFIKNSTSDGKNYEAFDAAKAAECERQWISNKQGTFCLR